MSQIFRAGVGAVIRDTDRRVLIFERAGLSRAWQFPQGGIEDGESPVEAVWRELREETGMGAGELRLVRECSEWLAYELPEAARSEKTGLGQVQRWFAFDLRSELCESPPVVLAGTGAAREFKGWRWATMEWAVENCVEFRRPTYARLGSWLTSHRKAE